MARAASSLPGPLSPVMRTVALGAATWAASWKSGRLPDDAPSVPLPGQLRPEKGHLAPQGAAVEGPPDQTEHLLFFEGLFEIVEGPELHGGGPRAPPLPPPAAGG